MLGFLDRFFFKKPRFRRWITKLIESDKNRKVRLLGAEVQINTLKEHGYLMASRLQGASALLRDEVPVLISIGYFMGEIDCFVDIGANVGVYTATISKFRTLNPIQQYAFEANPDTFARSAETNKMIGAEIYNCALSDMEGELEFVAGAVSHVFTTKDRFSSWSINEPTVKVLARRLDGFRLKGDRLFLKIDVEGQELPVLQGARGLFEMGRVKVCYIDGFSDPAVPRFLAELGFVFYDGKTLKPTDGNCFSLLAVKPAGVRAK